MSTHTGLGEFEHLVLLAVRNLGDRAYGASIQRMIETRTGRNVAIGAVYVTLGRLERKGYVSTHKGTPTPERGGRPKRLVQLETRGIQALERAAAALDALGLYSEERSSDGARGEEEKAAAYG